MPGAHPVRGFRFMHAKGAPTREDDRRPSRSSKAMECGIGGHPSPVEFDTLCDRVLAGLPQYGNTFLHAKKPRNSSPGVST